MTPTCPPPQVLCLPQLAVPWQGAKPRQAATSHPHPKASSDLVSGTQGRGPQEAAGALGTEAPAETITQPRHIRQAFWIQTAE